MMVILALPAAGSVSAAASEEDHWYDPIWPLGDKVEVEVLKDE